MPPLDDTAAVFGAGDRPMSVNTEVRSSYLRYAMSVIKARALPDVRDGLKPVHRRILYTMSQGFTSSGGYKKSARVVGDVMGKYHPHGDSAIYDAMVRMAQPFSMSVPLVDGQGNFGSVDGDKPAAMRYTEARMMRISDHGMTADLDENTVDFQPNYDDSDVEPTVLPARFPNMLVNGASGIAVGMATEIAPHNLVEVINAAVAMMDNPDMTVEEVMLYVKGPDFPTGGVIQGRSGIRSAYGTGNGSIPMSSVFEVVTGSKGRESIVITELPYKVNKKVFLEKVVELVNTKVDPKNKASTEMVIEGIADIRDESTNDVRIVIDIKKDGDANLVLNKLRRHTAFTTNYPYNAVCLSASQRPSRMGIVQILAEFLDFRRKVVERRTAYRANKARDELVRQVALFAARSEVDEVVRAIRASADKASAMRALTGMAFSTAGELGALLHETDPDLPVPPVFHLSEQQAKHVLDLRLSSLTALEQDEIAAKARELMAQIRRYQSVLNNPNERDDIIRAEMLEIRDKYGVPRRTIIQDAGPDELEEEDLVEDVPLVLTLTRSGYIKTTPVESFREQARGGKGRSGMETKEGDVVSMTMVCNSRDHLLFFTSRGIVHTHKAWLLPKGNPASKGRPLVNCLPLRSEDTITAIMAMPRGDEAEGKYLMFVTDNGDVRKNDVSDFAKVNKGGKIAMRLEDDNGQQTARLMAVLPCTAADDLLLATRQGKLVRFSTEEIRVFRGRNSTGNAGVKLADEDSVIGASILPHFELPASERAAYLAGGSAVVKEGDGQERTVTITQARMAEIAAFDRFLLTVTAHGYGKRMSSHDVRTTARGAQGVAAGNFSEVSGELVACFPVEEDDGLMLITAEGQVIRTRVSDIRKMGRVTRGVTLFDLPEGQAIVDVSRIPGSSD